MRCFLPVLTTLLLAACGGADNASTTAATSTANAPPAGEQAFAMCSACHTRSVGGAQRMGPNLHGVVGRRAGSNPGFAYSPALRDSGIVWDAQTLDAYLAAPAQRVPGTRMVMSVPDAARRKALVEYLSAP